MTPARFLIALMSVFVAPAAFAQQGRPPVPVPSFKMTGQENLPKTEREELDRKLAELAATRRAERAADLASMHAARAAGDFDLLEGDFETHENGMLYRDLVAGEGAPVRWGDTVETHYTTWYFDGRKFGSSRDHDKVFPVVNIGKARVIDAWNAALLGMREGGKRLVVAQSAVAYGKFDAANGVPGGTHLVFEIEAVKVVSAPLRPDVAKLKLEKNDSGLQWVDVVVGDGDLIDTGDTALVKYSGWLHDEPESHAFDSSFQTQRPYPVANIGESGVIAGWNEGLVGMRAGGRRVLLIPPKLAYGEEGSRQAIPPNATLLFLIEAWSVFPSHPNMAELELTKTESGLQWADLAAGKGPKSVKGDEVVMHFTGWLDGGQIFDSSWMVNQSVTVPDVGNAPLIDGLNEGLIGMRAGGERVLVVPPELAFGSAGANKSVPPDSQLTFLIQMLERRPAMVAPLAPEGAEAGN